MVEAKPERTIPVDNPATGEVFAHVPAGDGEDAAAAVKGWGRTPAIERTA